MDKTQELTKLLRDIRIGVDDIRKKVDDHEEVIHRLASQPKPGTTPTFGGGRSDVDHRMFGEILQNVYMAQNHKDSRAVDWLDEHGIYWQRDMQEDTDSEGGYLVPTEHLPEVLTIPERGIVEPKCRVIQMGSKTKNIPDMTTGVTTYWVAEEGTITESQPVLGQVQMTAKKQAGLVTCSNELLEDSAPDVQLWLSQIFNEAMGLEFDNQLLNGTGDPCSGVLTAKAGYSVVMSSGSTSFQNLTFDYLSEAISKIAPTMLAGACFIMHPDVLHYVRILKDDNGQPIWTPAGVGPGQVYGYDIIESTKAPGSGDDAANTAFIVFGNFRGFIKGDRRQLTVAVDPYGKFEKSQTRIRWSRRLALHVAQPKLFCRILTASE